MGTSTVVAFKDALITRLQARSGLTGVLVSWGVPQEEPPREWIIVGNVTSPADQEAAAMGRQHREEHYVLTIDVSVVGPFADDQATLAHRAAALVAEIEDELRDDCSVGGVVRVAQIVGVGLEERTDGNEREALMPVRVDVRQRI